MEWEKLGVLKERIFAESVARTRPIILREVECGFEQVYGATCIAPHWLLRAFLDSGEPEWRNVEVEDVGWVDLERVDAPKACIIVYSSTTDLLVLRKTLQALRSEA